MVARRAITVLWPILGAGLLWVAGCRDFEKKPLQDPIASGGARHLGGQGPEGARGIVQPQGGRDGGGKVGPDDAVSAAGANDGGVGEIVGTTGGQAAAGVSGTDFGGGEVNGGAPPFLDTQRTTGALADSIELLAVRRSATPVIGPFPPRVDLAFELPAPGDQGEANSGVAWAAAYLQTHVCAKQGGWEIESTRYQFSPNWIYNQLPRGFEQRIRPSEALQLLVDSGGDILRFFSDPAAIGVTRPNDDSLSRASRFKAATWSTLETSVPVLKRRLVDHEPIMATFDVYPDFDDLSAANKVYDEASGEARGRHAVVIVGYDDALSAFRFINSWGARWGHDGYGWLGYELGESDELSLDAYVLTGAKFSRPTPSNSLYVVEGKYLWRADNDFGDYTAPSLQDFSGSTAITSLGGKIYVTRGGSLLQVDPSVGVPLKMGEANFPGFSLMAAGGGQLLIVNGGKLWSISDLSTGATTELGSADWTGATAMAANDRSVFVARGRGVYEMALTNGVPSLLGDADWSAVTSMTAFDDRVFVIDADALWEIGVETGAIERVGSAWWPSVAGLTHLNGKLYAIRGDQLYEIDPESGVEDVVGRPVWLTAPLLTAVP